MSDSYTSTRVNMKIITSSDCVLTLMLLGFGDLRDLMNLSGLSEYKITLILDELEKKHLISKIKKGFIFKRTYYELTNEGYQRALRIYTILKEDAETIRDLIYKGSTSEILSILSKYSRESLWIFKALDLLEEDLIERIIKIRGQQREFENTQWREDPDAM